MRNANYGLLKIIFALYPVVLSRNQINKLLKLWKILFAMLMWKFFSFPFWLAPYTLIEVLKSHSLIFFSTNSYYYKLFIIKSQRLITPSLMQILKLKNFLGKNAKVTF